MAVIKDIRSQTKRTNGTRKLSQIKHIARHHSATTSGDFFAFWKTWNGVKGWGTGGYHEIILRDGTVQLCYDPEEITNGVANHNTGTYHICVVGNGSFTAAQEATFKERCLYNMKRLNVPVERVLGHREFSGASTACPGIDMNTVRNSLKGSPSTVIPASKPIAKDYLIYDDRGTEVEALQKYLNETGFPVEVGGYYNAATKKAVMDFQKSRGLVGDGIYGAASKAEMNKALKENTVKPAAPSTKEDDTLELSARQRQEIAATFKTARERGVFSSADHEKAIVENRMNQSTLLYLNNLIAGAALIGGERIK